jgi:hypothetical protein
MPQWKKNRGMRRCIVCMTGTDGRRHSVETDALSLFDAACNAQQTVGQFLMVRSQRSHRGTRWVAIAGACGRTASGVGLTAAVGGGAESRNHPYLVCRCIRDSVRLRSFLQITFNLGKGRPRANFDDSTLKDRNEENN